MGLARGVLGTVVGRMACLAQPNTNKPRILSSSLEQNGGQAGRQIARMDRSSPSVVVVNLIYGNEAGLSRYCAYRVANCPPSVAIVVCESAPELNTIAKTPMPVYCFGLVSM